jgi:hypothetical protein
MFLILLSFILIGHVLENGSVLPFGFSDFTDDLVYKHYHEYYTVHNPNFVSYNLYPPLNKHRYREICKRYDPVRADELRDQDEMECQRQIQLVARKKLEIQRENEINRLYFNNMLNNSLNYIDDRCKRDFMRKD